MYHPVRAMLWQLWRRHRWGLAFDVAYLAVAALIVALLPVAMRTRVVGFYLTMTGSGVLLHVLTIFFYGLDTDLSKRDSGFPQRSFTLPVPTWKLVSVPMLGGLAAVYALWAWFSLLVLRPCGYPARPWSPAAVVAAFAGVIQALAWTPFAEGWMRIVLTIVMLVLLGLSHFAIVFIAGIDSELGNTIGLSLVWLAAYGVAVTGVSRARRGDALQWLALQRLVQRVADWQPGRRREFRSAAQAQRWYELRRGAALAPCYVGLLLVMLMPILFIEQSTGTAKWHLALAALGMPPLMFAFFGATLGKPDPWTKSPISSFLATRPLSCAHLVAAKFRAAVVTSLLSCGMALAFLVVWLLFANNREALVRLCQGVSPIKISAIAVAGLVGWWAFTWKSLAESFYIGLTGREWVVNVAGIAFGGLFLVLLGGGLWLYFYPDLLPAVMAWTPWLLGAALAAKAGLAAWTISGLHRRRLVPASQLMQRLAAWCAIVAVSSSCAIWLLPRVWATPWQLIAGCVFLVPLSRLAAAPLALAWNRHR